MNVTKPFVPHFLQTLFYYTLVRPPWDYGSQLRKELGLGAGRGGGQTRSRAKTSQTGNRPTAKPLQCSAQPIISSFHVTGEKGEARIQNSRTVHPSMAGMPRLSPPFPAAAVTAVTCPVQSLQRSQSRSTLSSFPLPTSQACSLLSL